MTDRRMLADDFIAQGAWSNARREPLAGDASQRSYARLTMPGTGQTAILMDDPPNPDANGVDRFAAIAAHLTSLGFSAPAVIQADEANGFLLLEDLGDAVFARVIEADRSQERPLYEAATDFLIDLHGAPPPSIVEPLGHRLMAEMTAIVLEHYHAALLGPCDPTVIKRFVNRFEDLLRQNVQGPHVLVMRDYHAENLIWLPNRFGSARVGLLDFQDARCGHAAYDLVSLLQDARRDVPAGIEMMMIDRYVTATGADEHAFQTAYTTLGVQRNLRILGVFTRLATQFGKPGYVNLMPRVWLHVRRALEHPAMSPMAALIREHIPPPTEDAMNRLRGV